MLASSVLGITLSGCAVARLEDVPSAQVLDSRSGVTTQQSLTLPPDMSHAPVSVPANQQDTDTALLQSGGQQAAAAAEPGIQGVPRDFSKTGSLTKARWTVRFEDGGIDAESHDGEYCSGRQQAAGSGQRNEHVIRIACSDGRIGAFLVEDTVSPKSSGTLVFGKDREAAILISH